jgi:hypothetical protein
VIILACFILLAFFYYLYQVYKFTASPFNAFDINCRTSSSSDDAVANGATTSKGKHHSISYQTVRVIFMKYLEKAGISHKGYTIHCLRHTCATDLLNAGMRLECVQQLLGHSTIEMTRRYARLTDRTREEEYFRAMATIERGEINGDYKLDSELSAFLEEAQLLSSHDQRLHGHP